MPDNRQDILYSTYEGVRDELLTSEDYKTLEASEQEAALNTVFDQYYKPYLEASGVSDGFEQEDYRTQMFQKYLPKKKIGGKEPYDPSNLEQDQSEQPSEGLSAQQAAVEEHFQETLYDNPELAEIQAEKDREVSELKPTLDLSNKKTLEIQRQSLIDAGNDEYVVDKAVQEAKKDEIAKQVKDLHEEFATDYRTKQTAWMDKWTKQLKKWHPDSQEPLSHVRDYHEALAEQPHLSEMAMDYVESKVGEDSPIKRELATQLVVKEMSAYNEHRAKEKTEKEFKAKGKKVPTEAIEKFNEAITGIEEFARTNQEALEVKVAAFRNDFKEQYEYADKPLRIKIEAEFNALQNLVNEGAITVEEANVHLEGLRNARQKVQNEFQRKANSEVDRFRREHGALETTLDKKIEKAKEEHGVDSIEDKFGISEEAIQDYLNTYKKNFKEVMNEAREQSWRRWNTYDTKQKIDAALTVGMHDMIESVGGMAGLMGSDDLAWRLAVGSDIQRKEMDLPQMPEFKWSHLGDSDWWITKGVRTAPFMAALVAPGIGVGAATSGAVSKLAISNLAKGMIQGAAGAIAMRPLESGMEAGSHFQESLRRGNTVEVASEEAADVFKKNMNLIMLDAAQLGLIFTKGKSFFGKMATVGFQVGSEGVEEVYQEWAQEIQHNPSLKLWDFAMSPAGQEVFALGAAAGAIFGMPDMVGVATDGWTKMQDAIELQLLNRMMAKDAKKRAGQLRTTIESLLEMEIIDQQTADAMIDQVDFVAREIGKVPEHLPEERKLQFLQNQGAIETMDALLNDKNITEAQKDAVKRMRSEALQQNIDIQNGTAKGYFINGIPVTENTMRQYLNNEKFRGLVKTGAISIRIYQDDQMVNEVLNREEPAHERQQYEPNQEDHAQIDNVPALNGLIQSTEVTRVYPDSRTETGETEVNYFLDFGFDQPTRNKSGFVFVETPSGVRMRFVVDEYDKIRPHDVTPEVWKRWNEKLADTHKRLIEAKGASAVMPKSIAKNLDDEILSTLHSFMQEDGTMDWDAVAQKIKEDPGYFQFMPYSLTDDQFKALSEETQKHAKVVEEETPVEVEATEEVVEETTETEVVPEQVPGEETEIESEETQEAPPEVVEGETEETTTEGQEQETTTQEPPTEEVTTEPSPVTTEGATEETKEEPASKPETETQEQETEKGESTSELPQEIQFLEKDLPSKLPKKADRINVDGMYGVVNILPIAPKIKQKSVEEAVKPMISTDELRPAHTGIYHDHKNQVKVAIDGGAVGMSVIPATIEESQKNKIIDPKTGQEIEDKFPNYLSIIPDDNAVAGKMGITGLLGLLTGMVRASRFVVVGDSNIIPPIKGKLTLAGEGIYFNPKFWEAQVRVLAETGTKTVAIKLTKEDAIKRPIIIEDADNSEKFALVMPMMFQVDNEAGLVSEIEIGKGKEATTPPPKKGKPRVKKTPTTKKKITSKKKGQSQEEIDKTNEQIDDILGEIGDILGDDFNLKFAADPQEEARKNIKLLDLATKLAEQLIKLGYYKFKDFVVGLIEKIGQAKVEALYDYLKKAYLAYMGTAPEEVFDKMDQNPMVIRKMTLEEIIASIEAKEETQGETQEATTKEEAFVTDVRTNIVNSIAGIEQPMTKPQLEKLAAKYGLEAAASRELGELAVVLEARNQVEMGVDLTYENIIKLYENQPNLTFRSSETVKLQQYSTPVPIAYMAGLFTTKPGMTMFEPSAGNGAMTIINPTSQTTVNDIDARRRANLEKQGYKEVTGFDATNIPEKYHKQFDAVITNPPFNPIKREEIDGYYISALEHKMTIEALRAMKDDGRAAIIIGGHTEYKDNGTIKGRDFAFYNYLHHFYNVTDSLNISGELYRKMGASYPIRLILISGRKAEPKGFAPRAEDLSYNEEVLTFDDLNNRVQSAINKANANLQQQQSTGVGTGGVDTGSTQGVESEKPSGSTPVSTGQAGGSGKPATGTRGGSTRTGGGTSGTTRTGGEQSGVSGTNTGNTGVSGSGRTVEGRNTEGQTEFTTGEKGSEPEGGVPDTNVGEHDRSVKGSDLTGEHVEYKPYSKNPKSFGVSAPSMMATEMYQAFEDLEAQIGPVDDYVMNKLKYPTKEDMFNALSAEQIDGVALAIYNIEEKNQGIIIGDQTGIGKGRQAAAVLRYAKLTGRIPVLVTNDPKLFTDMHRDLTGIGSGNMRPFIVNARDKKTNVYETVTDPDTGKVTERIVYQALPKEGQAQVFNSHTFPADNYDYVASSYTQFASGLRMEKRNWLKSIAPNAIFVLDESHNAGGTGNTNEYFTEILQLAEGALYLSGTYAKKPENFPVYGIKTAIRDTGMTPAAIIEAVVSGGLALQEVVSSMLVRSGQMIRRERTNEDIEIDYVPTEYKKEDVVEMVDGITAMIRELISFQNDIINPVIRQLDKKLKKEGKEAAKAAGVSDLGIKNTQFASKLFNIVNQLLLCVNAEDTALKAIQQLEAGNKPFIALSNTMETLLSEDNVGDVIDHDYSFILERGLKGLLRYKETTPDGKKKTKEIDIKTLDEHSYNAFIDLRNRIRNMNTGLINSPIDVIVKRIEEAGYTVAEITGRKKKIQQIPGKDQWIVTNRKNITTGEAYHQFNHGIVDAVIVNRKGAVGASAHAAPEFKDQRKRVTITTQPELDINYEGQKRGRTNRTGQIIPPAYIYQTSPIPAQLRLQAMMRHKFKSLDANASSSQNQNKAIVDGMDNMVDFLNKYGDKVVHQYLLDNPEINELLNDPLNLNDGETEKIAPGTASKVAGRVAVLSFDMQEKFYSEVSEIYTDFVKYLKTINEYDLEVENLPLEAETIHKEVYVMGSGEDSVFGADAMIETVEANVLKKPMRLSEIRKIADPLLKGKSATTFMQDLRDESDAWHKAKKEEELGKIKTRYAEKIAQTRETLTATMTAEGLSAKEVDRRVEEEVAEIEKKRDMAIQGAEFRLDGKQYQVEKALEKFTPGHPKIFPDGGFPVSAIFMGYDLKEGKGKFLPGKVHLRFATNDSRRQISVPVSQTDVINSIVDATAMMDASKRNEILTKWDEQVGSKKDREERKIITGNVLLVAGKKIGKLVAYTDKKGAVKKGLLMSEAAVKAMEEQQEVFKQVPVDRLMDKIDVMTENDMMIGTEDGNMTIKFNKGTDRIIIQTEASKKKGGMYYLNDALVNATKEGVFEKRGDLMRASSFDAEKVLEVLSKEFKGVRMNVLSSEFHLLFPSSENLKDIGGKGASAKGARNIDDFEQQEGEPTEGMDPMKFKLFNKVIELIRKWAPNSKILSEVPRKALGVHYRPSGNIGLKSINNISTGIHELAHALDQDHGIVTRFMAENGPRSELRESLYDIYLEYYPGAKKSHAAELKAIEGYAVLLQHFSGNPTITRNDYPRLVEAFLTQDGAYAVPNVEELIREIKQIMVDYKSLSSSQKVGSRVATSKEDFVKGVKTVKQKSAAAAQAFSTQLFWKLAPLEEEARKKGTHLTSDDLSVVLQSFNSHAVIASHNIDGKDGFWQIDGQGNFAKKYDFNYKSIYDRFREDGLGGLQGKMKPDFDEFGWWLVARRAYMDFQILNEAIRVIDAIDQGAYYLPVFDEMSQEEVTAALAVIRAQNVKIRDAKLGIIQRDGWNELIVTEVYEEGVERFEDEARMFDTLMAENLKFLASAKVQLLKRGEMARLLEDKGYAPYLRVFYDDFMDTEDMDDIFGFEGDTGRKMSAGTKVSNMRNRHGSDKPIVHPLVSAITIHAEVIRKGMQQIVYNKIAEEADNYNHIFQKVQLKTNVDQHGRITFPQEKDGEHVVGRINYKRVAIRVDQNIKKIIDDSLTYQNTHIFFRIMQELGRMFRTSTTQIFLPWALSNFVVDQMTAAINTQTGMMPLITSAKELFRAIANKNSEEHLYYKEYLFISGQQQFRSGWSKTDYNKVMTHMIGSHGFTERFRRFVARVTDIISIPVNLSELATRLPEYIRARKEGDDQIVALEKAGQVSIPFHHIGHLGGQTGQSAMRITPYTNAAFQNLAQTIRISRTKKGRTTILVANVIAAVAGVTALMYNVLSGDEKDKEFWLSIHPNEMARHLFFKNFDGQWIKVRMPDQLLWLSTISNMIVADHILNADYKKEEYLEGVFSILPEQWKVWSPFSALMSYFPPSVKSLLEVGMNKKTYPTVRELDRYMETEHSELRYSKWNSELAIKLGKTAFAKEFDLSAIQIDHLIEGYAGRSFRYISQKPSAPLSVEDIFVRKLYFTSSRQLLDYYDIRENNNKDVEGLKDEIREILPELWKSADIYKTAGFYWVDMYLKNTIKKDRTPRYNLTRKELIGMFDLKIEIDKIDVMLRKYRKLTQGLNDKDLQVVALREKEIQEKQSEIFKAIRKLKEDYDL